jgi:TonB family protein
MVSFTRRALPLLAAVAVAGCPPPVKKPKDGTIVTVDGDPPDFPDGFDPGQPLPEPAAPDPGQFGLAYLEQVYPALRDGWAAFLEDARLRLEPKDPLNSPTLEAKLEITLDAHGGLIDVQRLRESGNADFDSTAEEIVREAAPFPAPGRDIMSDDGNVYIDWVFARDRRQAGVATAEVRRIEYPIDRAVPLLIDGDNLVEAAKRLQKAARSLPADVDPNGKEAKQLVSLTARVMVAALRDGLLVEDPQVQSFGIAAVTAAARAGHVEVAAASRELRSIASGSVDMDNRADAIAALGALDDREAAKMIAEILEKDQGGNPRLSGAAAGALVALGNGAETGKLIAGWLASGDRAKIGGALASLQHAAVPGTTAAAAKFVTDKDTAVRTFACRALGRQATVKDDAAAAWKALKKGLDDRDASVRAACAAAASVAAEAGARSKVAYWRLIELLKDKDDRVRAAAVGAALRLDPAKAPEATAGIAKDKSAVVLAAYADGLGFASGATPKKLETLAGHGEARVRVAAVRALARRDAAARKLAAALVVDPEQEVRLAAVSATDDKDALASLASDSDPLIAAAAQARGIVLRGRWGALVDALGAVAAEDDGGVARVDVAAAWLRAG